MTRILKDFQLFKENRNRITEKSNVKPTFKQLPKDEHTFTPLLSEGTKNRCRGREKITETEVMGRIEALIKGKERAEVQRQRAKSVLQAKEVEGCTFQPYLRRRDKSPMIGEQRYEMLYKKGEDMRLKREWLKELKESETDPSCTFKPNIRRTKVKME